MEQSWKFSSVRCGTRDRNVRPKIQNRDRGKTKARFVRVLTKKWSKVGSVIEVVSQSGSLSLFMRELYTENSWRFIKALFERKSRKLNRIGSLVGGEIEVQFLTSFPYV